MIVPSIDIMNAAAVQLEGGKELRINAGDPLPIAERFAVAGELAVIDLDAALGKGDNSAIIRELVRRYDCRVGGGIRSVERAIEWMNMGAAQVILGTAATPGVLSRLPRDRVIAALDAVHGEVVVDGWRQRTGATVLDRIDELRAHVAGFLVTFVEREGRMTGVPLDEAKAIVDAAGPDCRVTIAGGVASADDVAALDAIGADAQVGMALYSGAVSLGECVAAPLRSDRADGLIPTVVCDERGVALGLTYSNRETITQAVDQQRGVYWSRSRQRVWIKGATSGDTQTLLRVDADCDRDAVRFRVRQRGPNGASDGVFCHCGTRTCFGEADDAGGVAGLVRTLRGRLTDAPEGSYTRKLFEQPELLRAKLHEEADELIDAGSHDEAVRETADVLYFALVRAIAAGASLDEIDRELDLRARRVTRRSATERNSTQPRGVTNDREDSEG